jgi:GT2 family glycosyltransferase
VVDASPEDDTERLIKRRIEGGVRTPTMVYLRVSDILRGLTRQRNLALRYVPTDLVAFFDDDIVLEPGCLAELERVHREEKPPAVGVGAWMTGGPRSPDTIWRIRRALRCVADLRPGSYQRSGMSVPWAFLPPGEVTVEGDYLPGGATMWRTDAALDTQFAEDFSGYGQGEDLEFSLRVGRLGRLLMAPSARLEHLHAAAGRPDHFRLGYMAIRNRYLIHRRGLVDRSTIDAVRFWYAWGVDSFLLLRYMVVPSRILSTLRHLLGRIAGALSVVGIRGN